MARVFSSVGVVGLGTMGQPMARRLARSGYEVLGWNRTRARLEPLVQDMVVGVASPAEACQAELLVTMVSNDAALESILFEDGQLVSAGVCIHRCSTIITLHGE